MIRAVKVDNRDLYARQLDQILQMRRACRIEGHGWGGQTSRQGRETDEIDDAGVAYLMRIDAFGDVAASV